MESENEKSRAFLLELYRVSDGDSTVQSSMYDVGTSIGMERDEAGMVAEDLIIDGLVELVSLSGGVSLTTSGLKMLNIGSDNSGEEIASLKLGNAVVVDDERKKAIIDLLELYKKSLENVQLTYVALEEIVIDIKTLELQLISCRPKTETVRAVLNCLAEYALKEGFAEIEKRIAAMTRI